MKIKAAVLREYHKPLSIEELELEDPKEHEILVRIAATGFCHSDLHFMVEEITTILPKVLGHETAGIVEKVGPGVTKVQPGDHIVGTYNVPCGHCHQCINGRGNLCETYFDYFLNGLLLDGTSRLRDKDGNQVGHGMYVSGFSNYSVMPEQAIYKLPKELPLEEACFLGCCVATGFGSVENVGKVKAGNSAVVYGCGGVGLSTIRGASLRYANPLIAVDLEGSKEEIAREFGATHFIDSSKEDPVPKIQELTDGHGAEIVFEAIGDPGAQVQAYWSSRIGGTLVFSGATPEKEPTSLPLLFLTMHAKSILGTIYGEVRIAEDMPRLIDLACTGSLKVNKLGTRKVKLEEINDVAEAMLKRQVTGRWVICPE
jgi:S-(hydroxymethyl)glutathione dehydrogenase/alcohol dehydrogenase